MTTIILIGVTVVLVLGLKIVMSEDMLLEKLGGYFERKIDEGYKIFDLFFCPYCMGTVFYWVAVLFAMGLDIIPSQWDLKLLIRWPLVLMSCSIISGNFWNVYLTINKIKERNEAETNYLRSLLTNENETLTNENETENNN